jgi:filamentous hemagglutinin family protein
MLKTGHRTKYHLRAFEFLAARRRSRAVLTCTLLASFLATMPTGGLQAGDILRGGASAGNAKRNSEARANAGAAAAEAAKVRAQDRLARTTKAVNDMRALQTSARAAAGASAIPNGITQGGLQPQLKPGVGIKAFYTKDDFQNWDGADAPTAADNNINIKQTAAQALLHWETFNVGSQTTVNFDQSAGGADSGKWIAFNKVFDPAAKPSQIRGKINAQGQVYIINQNGIIFGAGSQVNARTLVASSLPINDNLIKNGLLNNKDAQFLFSGLDVPGGSDGTPAFIPTPLPTGAKYGDVVVERGALLQTPTSADGNGGRVMLVGANVRNEGSISTPAGQTILAAGLQVGIQAHNSEDPSLRGLDVWVGAVGDYAGTATNTGIISSLTGNIWFSGKDINNSGVLESSTSVALNGRIDLIANYGAVGNPNYDNKGIKGAGAPIFINQHSGSVTFHKGSITRILPEYSSDSSVPGLTLPEASQVNVQARNINFLNDSKVMAPNANVRLLAGGWSYIDGDQNGTVFLSDGKTLDPLFENNMLDMSRMFFSSGLVLFENGSLLDVSGSTGVTVPQSQNLISVQLRGSELADSPVQRNSSLRGKSLTVDLRDSGEYNGTFWQGTPLGDLTSLAGIIKRNVSQLTVNGGTVAIQAGNSILAQQGSTIDVSGGFMKYEGGLVQKSRLLRNGRVVSIQDAKPDVTYDGVYDGKSTSESLKWGVKKTFLQPLAPTGTYTEKDYIQGADGGALSFTAPSIILDGKLIGQTITGPKQLGKPGEMSALSINFQAEGRFEKSTDVFSYYKTSPAAPSVVVTSGNSSPTSSANQFALQSSWWESGGGGFGSLFLDNRDGDLLIPEGIDVMIPANGGFSARASNVLIAGTLTAPGGTIQLTSYNYSPYDYLLLTETGGFANKSNIPDPVPNKGVITLLPSAKIDVSGMIVDNRPSADYFISNPRALSGGSVSLEGYEINLANGGAIDASGGVLAEIDNQGKQKFTYGDGGKISILAGRDPNIKNLTGGALKLDSSLSAYSANKGGALSILANLIQIGGQQSDPSMLVLAPSFFRSGGFTSYLLTGIGKSTQPIVLANDKQKTRSSSAPASRASDLGDTYIPAIRIVENSILEPVAEQLLLDPILKSNGKLAFERILKREGERKPVSIKFAATGADDPFTTDFIEARGDIVMENGSKIRTDAGASVLFGTDENLSSKLADTVSIGGSIQAPGGTVAIFSRGEFRLSDVEKSALNYPLPTIYLSKEASISVAGKPVYSFDAFGRRLGSIYSGGRISIDGNIVTEAGTLLDVSGSHALFDLHPLQLSSAKGTSIPASSGLTTLPYGRQFVTTELQTNGGLLELHGSQMLFSDAKIIGKSGGSKASGGTLSVFSGRYYSPDPSAPAPTSADINMVVTQSTPSLALADSERGVGLKIKYSNNVVQNNITYSKGDPISAMGYFAADSFREGGFSSLDLGYKFLESSNLPFGGNVEFRGPISISATGSLRVAAGGVIRTDSTVNLTANYLFVGQRFREPTAAITQIPSFKKLVGDAAVEYFPTPTYSSSGQFNFAANLIDIGTSVFENTGRVSFTARDGDIRGGGVVSVAGDIEMAAGQIYAPTLLNFSIFAYDYNAADDSPREGSVTIESLGTRPTPYSAGSSINIFASVIKQDGTLKAPFGSISLGWDGTDWNLSSPSFDSPSNSVVGTNLITPTTRSVILGSKSLTSVSAIDPTTGVPIVLPFGISPDGLSWYDPRGQNITTSGLPQKKVAIMGRAVDTQQGSVVDIRGGGDLLAYRWVSGTGGSHDLLGDSTGANWSSLTEYQAGDLVSYGGKTWSARRSIDPDDFTDSSLGIARKTYSGASNLGSTSSGVTPNPPIPGAGSIYWLPIADSYAILPGYTAKYAPSIIYNSNADGTAGDLGGDPGYTSTSLKIGDQIQIDGMESLKAGTYTLLPRRYGILPGAYLITPKSSGRFSNFSTTSGSLSTSGFRVDSKSSGTFASYSTAEGTSLTSGIATNSFRLVEPLGIRSLFEIAPSSVVSGRVEYQTYLANDFIRQAATRLDTDTIQELPIDSGYLAFHGNSALKLEGKVFSSASLGGRGAKIDTSSDADIFIKGRSTSVPQEATVVLEDSVLNSWGAESLLVGGLRRYTSSGTEANVRANSVILNNSGSSLEAPEIILVAKSRLSVTSGSQLKSSGPQTTSSENLILSKVSSTQNGEGALLRVSDNAQASYSRASFTDSIRPIVSVDAGAMISGRGLIIDSTFSTLVNPNAILDASNLTMGSGQISIIPSASAETLTGSEVDSHLVLTGVPKSSRLIEILNLLSYRTVDVYGGGNFGGQDLGKLRISASGIRGINRGDVAFSAQEIEIVNTALSKSLTAPTLPLSGTIRLETANLKLGDNDFSVSGYEKLHVTASKGVIASGNGKLNAAGALEILTPNISASQGVSYGFVSTKSLSLDSEAQKAFSGGLGATLTFTAASIAANTAITLPSGSLTLQSTGSISVGGQISVAGSSKTFYDITRYANAGSVTMISSSGDVELLSTSRIDISADSAGGSAGSLSISTPAGQFLNSGTISRSVAPGEVAASLNLDLRELSNYSAIGAFWGNTLAESLSLRVRTDDVNVTGQTNARKFSLSADEGSILVSGTINAAGRTGGDITLSARKNVTLEDRSLLDVSALDFSSAGKGGSVRLEAGAINTALNPAGRSDENGMVTVADGSTIDLGVDSYQPGGISDVGSSAFLGKFSGTLHLRAPRVDNTTLNVSPLEGNILNPSSVIVEGFRVYNRANHATSTDLREQFHGDNKNFMEGEVDMVRSLLAGRAGTSELGRSLVISPGVEVVHLTGDLLIGPTPTGPSSNNGADPSNDWDLSSYRYGAKQSPGVLTLRAFGDLVFQNALSDGFKGHTQTQTDVGLDKGRELWLANLMSLNPDNPDLPANAQSWSYRLVAGADLTSTSFGAVRPLSTFASNSDSGSIRVGNFYGNLGSGSAAETAKAISPNGSTSRFQVVRTGTGRIDIAAARDVQLRNVFASIYTAGVAIPTPTKIYSATRDDFSLPQVEFDGANHPDQGNLGNIQQIYPAHWAMAGGSISIQAQSDLRRVNRVGGVVVTESSRQIPTNWMYRRGNVDSTSGTFGATGLYTEYKVDASASTAWWIDYSNFFEGIGALGGGDIALLAGRDIINTDAFVPTNARTESFDPSGNNIQADQARTLEYGGGNLLVKTGRNIDGGIYYVEKGKGTLKAGNQITTNSARAISGTDPSNRLPTTLLVGRSQFDVTAQGNILLGPTMNVNLMPQGLNNKFWYKTYFQTYGADSGLKVSSFGGGIMFQLATVLPGTTNPRNIFGAWIDRQNYLASGRASTTQPWIRIAETSAASALFDTALSIAPPSFSATAFSGDVGFVGSLNMFPSPIGSVEVVASGGITGINPAGRTTTGLAWASTKINLSDSDPALSPGIQNPYSYQSLKGRFSSELNSTPTTAFLAPIDSSFKETGSYIGAASSIDLKRSLHAQTSVFSGSTSPAKFYGAEGDITGLTLFSAKPTQILSGNDITDISLYIQNLKSDDVSIISAARDIIPYNANAARRAFANDLSQGNLFTDTPNDTVLKDSSGKFIPSTIIAGDIQINGPGYLEVLAGRNLDLGTGPNYDDGTGVGITSIGNYRNPFLPFDGASIITIAGIQNSTGGPALGLSGSNLNLKNVSTGVAGKGGLNSRELILIAGLKNFFSLLRQAGVESETTGSYELGYSTIDSVFGSVTGTAEIFTRARDIRTSTGGSITIAAPTGSLTMASDIFGNPTLPPGIVTEYGGEVSIFTNGNVDIGRTRIFTLRGGDMTIWSSTGDIAAGTSPKTVVTAPPTRVVIDTTSADVATDLGGLATGGGIGVLASVEGVEPGDVNLIAPEGTVDAGDAGIQATGNIKIAAAVVVNADNISAGGTSTGVPSAPVAAAPNVGGLASGSSSTAATSSAAESVANQSSRPSQEIVESPSLITVEILGYGGGDEG